MSDQKPARERIVQTAARLLEQQGYHATGLKQIVKESAAPMGSLYHYFPNGKEELAVEAISCTQMAVTKRIKAALAGSTRFVEGVQTFMLTLADQLDADPTCYGGSISTIAMESPNVGEQLRSTCATTYETWRLIFKQGLLQEDFTEQAAEEVSTLISGAIEGSIILSKVRRNAEALRMTARMLTDLIELKRPA